MIKSLLIASALLALCGANDVAQAGDLVAAVLPSSRSTAINIPTTVYATMINTSGHEADGCAIRTSQPNVTISFQPTNPASNQPQGRPNAPVIIPTGGSQSFVLTLTSSIALQAVDLPISFTCTNTQPAPITSGLDTLLLNVAATAPTDIVALAVTATNDGVLALASELDAKAFAVASINLGPEAQITVTPDFGDFSTLPVTLSICQTTIGGACMAAPTPSVALDFKSGATPTFGIFAVANGPVPFAPSAVRISVLFTDANGVLRGRTSIAPKTPEKHHLGVTPGGIYVGTWLITSSPSKPQPIAAMVSENGEFHLLPGRLASDPANLAPIMRETLGLNVFDNLTFIATGHSYAPGLGTTTVTGDVTATGIYSPHQALVVEYRNGAETGVFHLNYVARFYERQTPLAVVAGTWNLRDEGLNLGGSLTIAKDGTFTGQTSAGCGLSGTVSVIDNRYDVLGVAMNAAACGATPATTFSGLTTFQHTVPRKELIEQSSKALAVGDPTEVTNESADENQPADKEMLTELSNATQSVSAFVTAK